MKTYILIIIFKSLSTGDNLHIVNAEFNSFETCEAARIHIVKSVSEKWIALKSQGCYKK